MKLFNRKPSTTAVVKPLGFQFTHKKTHDLVGELFIYFEEKYRPKRLMSAKLTSVRAHHCALRAFARYLGRPAKLSDLTEKYLRGFAALRVQCTSRGTVRRDLDCLIALARFAFERDDLKVMPGVRSSEVPPVVPIERRATA